MWRGCVVGAQWAVLWGQRDTQVPRRQPPTSQYLLWGHEDTPTSNPEHSTYSSCLHNRQELGTTQLCPSVKEPTPYGPFPWNATRQGQEGTCSDVGDTQGVLQNKSQTPSSHTKPFRYDTVTHIDKTKLGRKAGIARALGWSVTAEALGRGILGCWGAVSWL